jgi:hypothetical protein
LTVERATGELYSFALDNTSGLPPGASTSRLVDLTSAMASGFAHSDLATFTLSAAVGDGISAKNWDVATFRVLTNSDPVDTWRDEYARVYAIMAERAAQQPALAIGTDFNGLSTQMPFTWAGREDQEGVLSNLPSEFAVPAGDVTGERTFDVHYDGIAHVGLVADMLNETGPQTIERVYQTARQTIEVWQRAERAGALVP